ncbi:GntR family transcriptional regulator [Listeria aquatica]|uniref:GntR family transcriptional regulator n=1 Tax=Listeria aquatica TaxID=1494960 RepID=UPI0031F516E3
MPEKETFEKLAYATIKEKILSGKLRVGDHISEASIASELHISRTPVRKAIARLEAEQLLEIKVNRGATVIESEMTASHFVSLLEIVEILVLQTISKLENKRITFEAERFEEKKEILQKHLQKKQETLYIEVLFDSLKSFVHLMQNSYADRFIQVLESDFDLKAQKEIKVLPLILAAETEQGMSLVIKNLQSGSYEEARKNVKELINKFIVQTFR